MDRRSVLRSAGACLGLGTAGCLGGGSGDGDGDPGGDGGPAGPGRQTLSAEEVAVLVGTNEFESATVEDLSVDVDRPEAVVVTGTAKATGDTDLTVGKAPVVAYSDGGREVVRKGTELGSVGPLRPGEPVSFEARFTGEGYPLAAISKCAVELHRDEG
jgi:hypothetical protein